MVAGIVLAAGLSARMGSPKQLLRLNGEALVRRAARTALESGLTDVVVVLGGSAELVKSELAGLAIRTVFNREFADGLSTSLATGVAALSERAEAVVILLADQPLLRPEIVRALVERYRAGRPPIVVPRYDGQPGNPVLFDRALFVELAGATGDVGARGVVRAHLDKVAFVDVQDSSMQQDVDTWEDYERVRSQTEAESD